MILKTRHFAKWALKAGLTDSLLKTAIIEIQLGLLDADLGGGIVKKRIALPGKGKRGSTRTLLATNFGDRWFFVFGFQKNDRESISENELATLRKLSRDLLGMTIMQLENAIMNGALLEIKHEE